MLQSIQFNGSGPPTYVYSQKAVGSTMDFYHVLAIETREYEGRRQERERKSKFSRRAFDAGVIEHEEFKVIDNCSSESLQEVYQKEYGRRESFLWKQR